MDEQIFSEFPKDFTASLGEHCKAPAPTQAFISGLEQRLLERQAVLNKRPRSVRRFARSSWLKFTSLPARRRWRYAVVLLLTALVIALFSIGPQRVLAQVQHWLGYVPGIGFVDLDETRVLVNPVEMSREGVHLRVEQLIAGPERTEVLISSPGLSEADLPWPNEAVQDPAFNAFLLLPDGGRLETIGWELTIGAGKLEFPALPAGVDRVTLIVPRLPLVPAGTFPEDWEIPLTLRSTTNELNEELFPQPYNLPDASDSHHGITLRVLDVAQTASETAIRYQVEWADPDWQFRFGLSFIGMPELRDDLGHIYWESPQSHGSLAGVAVVPLPEATSTVAAPSQTDTIVFPALSLSASQASLQVDSLEFWTPAEASFHVDLGSSPEIGDSWPLDVRLEIAGFPVHLTEARLREETVDLGDGRSEQRPVLQFSLDPLEERDGFRLFNFGLVNEELGIYGSAGQSFSNGREVYEGQAEFTAGKLPSGSIELQVLDASLLVRGPWEVEWDIPGRDPSEAALPVHLFPEAAEPAGLEIQPVVEEVFLSDRLTAVKLGGSGLPADATFVQALSYDPSRNGSGLYLEDNWARRYLPGQNEAIIRPGEDPLRYDPRWQFFAPLQPLAQDLTLRIPAMEVFVPANTSFEVEVPQGLTFEKEEYEVTTIGGGGPERQETQTRWVSDPWAVDLNLEVAGYELHFTEAQVQHEGNSDPQYLLFLTGKPRTASRGELHLNELRFSKIEQPDGTTVQVEKDDLASYPYGGVGPTAIGSNQLRAMIVLNVTDASRDALLSGRYRVEINGVTSWVPGPWELRFSLSGK
ncbi:MAG: hypothetical protein EHM40_19590 [Chloroflexi bacterium]|nr:MAG: hypothetical protein EHM40_19590 [Chloroflexota bacterium]